MVGFGGGGYHIYIFSLSQPLTHGIQETEAKVEELAFGTRTTILSEGWKKKGISQLMGF